MLVQKGTKISMTFTGTGDMLALGKSDDAEYHQQAYEGCFARLDPICVHFV